MSCWCQKRTSPEGVVGCTSCITDTTTTKQTATTINKNNTLKNIDIIDYNDSVCIQLRFYDCSRPYKTQHIGFDVDPQSNFYYQPEENIEFYKKAIKFFGKNKKYYITNCKIDFKIKL